MGSTFTIKQGDILPKLRATLKDGTGAVIDLTLATSVRLIVKNYAGQEVVNANTTIVSPPTSGIVEYAWITANTATAGSFRGEFEINFSTGQVQTVPNDSYITIQIIPQLGSQP